MKQASSIQLSFKKAFRPHFRLFLTLKGATCTAPSPHFEQRSLVS